jgi:Spy/CpxP family protein refolding chaperone
MALFTNSKRKVLALTLLLLIAVFLAGASSGALLIHLFQSPFNNEGPPPESRLVPIHELNLNNYQQQKAHEIGEKYREQLDAIRKSISPEVENIHSMMEEELKKVLTPEQIKLHDQIKLRRSNRRGPMGPMGPMGSMGPMEPME